MDLSKGEIWRIFAKLTFIMSSLVVITSAFSCNFDTSMCGFVQDSIDDFNWTRNQGSTPSLNTGPSADHTSGNGYYMYIEASYPRQPGDYARLNSPLLQFSGSMCLQFYYYMYGARMGTLTVNTNGSNVFNASGDKGNQWLGVAINVHLLGMYMVTFKGTVGGNYKSDIAIDDFVLESGSCNSKYCVDPGTPVHGSRNVDSTDGTFPDGTIVSFQCNANYKLSGAKKIVCTKGKWSEKKLPRCLSQASSVCPLPPPTFAHAHVKSNPVLNTKGSYVEYACDLGYVSDHHPPRLLCDKDSKTLGYKWSGNITCEKVKCSPPPPPRKGHGNVSISTSGSTTEASYYCNPGYVMFDFRQQLVDTFVMKCDPSGSWSSSSPTCLTLCPPPDVSHAHGYIALTSPRLYFYQGRFVYPEGVEVTIACDDLYKLQGGTGRMQCLESGEWSRSIPRCVRGACKSPDSIKNGSGTSNNTENPSQFPIWTVVTFNCMAGYKLVGDSQRQCMPDGTWSEKLMPECQASTVRCEIPQNPDHGEYDSHGKTYKLNEVVTLVCIGGYYLWGEAKKKCCGLDNGQSAWLPTSSKCSEPPTSDYSVAECLEAGMFDQKCKEIGKHAAILNDIMFCKAPSADESSTSSGKRDSELDKMTIVVATAGSTLGALIVLLTALVCFRRFHRSRRFRRYSFRSRRYSDDDRIAIIAAYTGDVHFILPSYDEAISQVERSPPSFESVVEGAQGSANEPPPNSNNTSDSQAENLEAISASENTNSAERVGDSTSIQEHDATAEQQPIRIVSNPLAVTASDTRSNETVQTADPASETGVCLSLNSSDAEVWPDRPPESLPSSSSEDDLTSSQTQPLLGNGSRGVLV